MTSARTLATRCLAWGRRIARLPGTPFVVGLLLSWTAVGMPSLRLGTPTMLWDDRTFLLLHGRLFLDWPHILRSEWLGNPDGLDLLVFPFADFTQRLIQFATTVAAGNPIRGANWYYIAVVAANFAAAFLALRDFRLRPWAAMAGAVAFASLPFFGWRSHGHDYLAAYYPAPLAFVVARRAAMAAGARIGAMARRIMLDPVILASCAVIATSGVYYAFFAMLLWAFAGPAFALRERDWRFLPAFALPCVAVSAVLGGSLGLLFSAATPGAFPPRVFEEQALYGLRSADIVQLLAQYGLAPDLLQSYLVQRGPMEGADAWPGLLLSVFALFAAVYGALATGCTGPLRTPRERERFGPVLAAYLAFALIFCSPWGLGLLFNLLLMPEIRAQNRVAPYFAFAAILLFLWSWRWVMLRLVRRVGRRAGMTLALVALALLVVANAGGSLGALSRQQRALRANPAYAAEMTSLRALQAAADANGLARVLQLPALPWPEAPMQRDFRGYTHLLPFIFSPPGDTRRWSYGAAWGSPGLARLQVLGRLVAWPCVVAEMAGFGFDAVMIDRRAYDAAELAAWDARLSGAGARLVSDDPLRRLYRLPAPTPRCDEPALPLDGWANAGPTGALVSFLEAGTLYLDDSAWGFFWGRGPVQRILLPLRGLGDGDIAIDVRGLQLPGPDGRPAGVALRIGGSVVATLPFANAMQVEVHRAVIPRSTLPADGFAVIELIPVNGPQPAARVNPVDPRRLGFGIAGIRLSHAAAP